MRDSGTKMEGGKDGEGGGEQRDDWSVMKCPAGLKLLKTKARPAKRLGKTFVASIQADGTPTCLLKGTVMILLHRGG